MEKVLSTLLTMPDFLKEMFTEHMVFAVAGVLIFILALMVPGRIGSLLRKVVILANVLFAMAGGFMGRLQGGYQIICLSALSLLILFIVRMIVRISGAIKQRKIDARIEERALAKAAKRRGSFKKKQGYSGESREIDDEDFVPPDSSRMEIRQVIEEEISEGKARHEATLAAFESERSEIQDLSEIEEEVTDEIPEKEPEITDVPDPEVPDAPEPEMPDAPGPEIPDIPKPEHKPMPKSPDAPKPMRVPEPIFRDPYEDEPSYVPLRQDDDRPDMDYRPEGLPEGYFYARPRQYNPVSAKRVLENDVSVALTRLAELRDSGIMTEAEFEEKKAELLARIS